MSKLEGILKFNKVFVEKKLYKNYKASKFPSKKIAVLSCMDTRLSEFLPAALGLKNGDAKVIKNAGAIISHPFGSVMRSLLICIYELNVKEILVIGHYDCGMQNLNADKIIEKMQKRGISKSKLDMLNHIQIDIKSFFAGFDCVENSIAQTVKIIKEHPLVPKDVKIYGLVIDPTTGELTKLET